MENNLELYYPGDEAWVTFVNVHRQTWHESSSQMALLKKMDNQLDLAITIYNIHNGRWQKWIESQIPSLDYLTPLECLRTPTLIKRLRTVLMRM